MEIFLLVIIILMLLGSPSYTHKLKEMDEKLDKIQKELQELKKKTS